MANSEFQFPVRYADAFGGLEGGKGHADADLRLPKVAARGIQVHSPTRVEGKFWSFSRERERERKRRKRSVYEYIPFFSASEWQGRW
jgi:hypothetical protein